MKAIISHDIDHLTVWEHYKDLIIPKFIVRAKIELLAGKISFSEYFSRLGDLFKNKWQNIDELILFNKEHQVQPTFFVGVNKGLGLVYSIDAAQFWVNRIRHQKCDIGLHGIAFSSLTDIMKEHDCFMKIAGTKEFGIRMHYLRMNEHTINYLSQTGYLFDATQHEFKNPYRNGRMWEFPFQVMDGWIIDKNKRWQVQTLKQAIENTKRLIDKAQEMELKYFSIVFHDRYFNKSFRTWRDWYIWLIGYLKDNDIRFTSYSAAISELSNLNK
ncbi:MAG: hypothetical protein V1781_02450 [Bacteroidota bacterium]